jgi:hypothetical protein
VHHDPDPSARPARQRLRALGASATVAVLAGALAFAWTPAPSGRLGTATDEDLPTAEPSPLASLPSYDPATTVAGYAPDFPRDLLAAPEDATVVASSAAPGTAPLTDVTLNLTTRRTADEVLAQLAQQLEGHGFARADTRAETGLTAQTAFTRRTDGADRAGDPLVETLLVGVLDDGAQRLVTVSGSVVVPEG